MAHRGDTAFRASGHKGQQIGGSLPLLGPLPIGPPPGDPQWGNAYHTGGLLPVTHGHPQKYEVPSGLENWRVFPHATVNA